MTQVFPRHKPPDRKPAFLLNRDGYAAFLETLAVTRNYTAACGVAGWSTKAEQDWRRRGSEAQELRAQGREIPETELPYLRYKDEHDQAIHDSLVLAGQAVRAHLVDREITETLVHTKRGAPDGNQPGPILGQETRRTTKLRESNPDLAVRVLERGLPEDWSPIRRLDVRADLELSGHAVQLAASFASWQNRMLDGTDDVIEGEIIDDLALDELPDTGTFS